MPERPPAPNPPPPSEERGWAHFWGTLPGGYPTDPPMWVYWTLIASMFLIPIGLILALLAAGVLP
jgi:hypothetical protein